MGLVGMPKESAIRYMGSMCPRDRELAHISTERKRDAPKTSGLLCPLRVHTLVAFSDIGIY